MRALLLLCAAVAAMGHDAPAQVTVQLHLRSSEGSMQVLARIPLEAVRDVDFPETADGYLDVTALSPRLAGLAKLWIADSILLEEDGQPAGPARVTAARISVESDRSFGSYEAAAAHLREALPERTQKLYWKQVYLDAQIELPVRNAQSRFSLRPGFAGLGERVQTVVHYADKTFAVPGDVDVFPLEPTWAQAAWLFVRMGFVHILEGPDHLLFLFCLVIPLRRARTLIVVATAFTVAHSVTMVLSALDLAPGGLWFPPLVEFAIAASIAVMALGNVLGWTQHNSWAWAFGFGLVHGFGFSFALRESLQFAGTHLAGSLAAFNAGVEAGQLAALSVMAPAVWFVLRRTEHAGIGRIVLSTLAAHTGWHWMWERWDILRRYPIPVPEWTAAEGALLLRWVAIGMGLWGVGWAGNRWLRTNYEESRGTANAHEPRERAAGAAAGKAPAED